MDVQHKNYCRYVVQISLVLLCKLHHHYTGSWLQFRVQTFLPWDTHGLRGYIAPRSGKSRYVYGDRLQHSFLTETEITKQFHNLLRECILSSYSNWTGKTIWKYADRLAVVGGKSDLYIKNCLEDCFGHYESGPQILSNFLWHLSFLFFLFIRYLTIPRHITIFWWIFTKYNESLKLTSAVSHVYQSFLTL